MSRFDTVRIPIGRTRYLLPGLLAVTYVAGCLLPGEPAAGERIEFRFDFPQPYRVPLAGSVEPTITIAADGRVLQNPRYRLESLDTAVVRVDASGRRLEGVARGPAAVRVSYHTAVGTPDTVLPIQVVVAQVRVNRPSLALPHLGARSRLNATAWDANNLLVLNVPFTWSTADSTVAMVNDTGLVTAIDEGTTIIVAAADGVADSSSILVTQAAAAVRIAPELDTVRTVGRSVQFIALAIDSNSTIMPNARPRWTTSDSMVARIDSIGRATATGGGMSRIIANVGAVADTAILVVKQVVRFLTVTPALDTLTAITEAARVVASASDSLNFPIPAVTVSWTTSDSTIARVDTTGLVTAAANGVVLITAASSNHSAFATVVVFQQIAETRVSPDSVNLTGAGDTARLHAVALDRNAFAVSGAAFTWRSTDGFVATVDTTGLVTARVDGSAGIMATAELGGRSDTATVSVTGAPPPPGVLLIRTTTTGPNPDPDGYMVVVDEICDYYYGCYYDWTAPVGVNDSVAWTPAPPGTHTVGLSGLTNNCTVAGQNPVSVTTSPGVTTQVTFSVSCVQTGSVRVTTATTGADLDPDGYGVQVIGGYGPYSSIGVNASYTFDQLLPGIYGVELGSVAANCSIGGPASQAVTVVGGATADVAFAITCEPLAAIRVAVATMGVAPDADGYLVTVAGPSGSRSAALPSNGTALIDRLMEGTYTVQLDGVALNCTVTTPNGLAISVSWGDTADAVFAVACVPPTTIRVTVATTGVDPDPDGYFVTAVGADRSRGGAVASNGAVVIDGLIEGTYSVTLGSSAVNCTVTGPGSLTVFVAAGDTADVAFDVGCTTAELLAIAMSQNGNTDIYVVKSNGTGLVRLTIDAAADYAPAWSATSGKIAFVSERDGNSEIYVMNADGSGQLRLTTNAGTDRDPAWSPDGLKLAFWSERDGNPEIYVMNADGSSPVRVTFNTAIDIDPAWSPDGLKIAFASNRDAGLEIYQMNANGSGVTRLTFSDGNRSPNWSPSGGKLVYSHNFCDYYYGCVGDLYVVNADGSGAVPLPTGEAYEPVWSPDGGWVAFTGSGYYGVSGIRGDGTGLVPMVANAYQPAWRR